MEQKMFDRRTEEEVFRSLKEMPGAYRVYQGWNEELKRRFVDFCTGKKTLPVLPMEDILMDGESAMVMDILVRLTEGTLVLVEIQKIPYYFPAERASCYSADLLLRQYSRVKTEKGKSFSYKDLRKVYTIVFYEQSIEAFKAYGESFIHHARMVCDSGLELNFLQEFHLVALDVFRKSEYAKRREPEERLAGWLSFLCTESAEEAEELCRSYPWLSELYAEMAQFGRKPEELMTMFSEMLREMDRNTIRYMVDDMKEQIEKGKEEQARLQEEMVETKEELTEMKGKLTETEGKLTETEEQLTETRGILAEKDAEIARLKALLEGR